MLLETNFMSSCVSPKPVWLPEALLSASKFLDNAMTFRELASHFHN